MLRRDSQKVLLDSSGFTLIEMMVALAIAGALAAIAIPNFSKMSAVARQAEAKTALGMIVTQENSFFTQFGFYTACLNQIGAVPGAGDRYYTIGFRAADATANLCGTNGTSACTGMGSYGTCTATPVAAQSAIGSSDIAFASNIASNMSKTPSPYPANGDFPTGTGGGVGMGIGIKHFSAGAAGNISSSATSFDTWTMTDSKALSHTNSGI